MNYFQRGIPRDEEPFSLWLRGDVQELCDALWSVTDESARILKEDLSAALHVVFSREKKGFDNLVADLTANQLTVLRGLAEYEGARVFTSEFMNPFFREWLRTELR